MPEWKEETKQRLASLKREPTREAEIIEELAQHIDDRGLSATQLRARPNPSVKSSQQYPAYRKHTQESVIM
jgi:hypothetical protein